MACLYACIPVVYSHSGSGRKEEKWLRCGRNACLHVFLSRSKPVVSGDGNSQKEGRKEALTAKWQCNFFFLPACAGLAFSGDRRRGEEMEDGRNLSSLCLHSGSYSVHVAVSFSSEKRKEMIFSFSMHT